MQVGVRDLRDGLSSYLRYVGEGHEVTVTDHGKSVARLSPVDQPNPVERLIAQGLVEPAREPKEELPELIDAGGPVSDLVDDQRR